MKTLYLTAVALLLLTIKPFAQCSVTISGDTCEGGVLTAHATGNNLQQLLWKRYNQLVFTSTIKTGYNPNGITVAGGNGEGSAYNQVSPNGVYVDNSGNVYVCDGFKNRVQKWLPGATEGITVAGGNSSGSAADQLDFPVDVWVDSNQNVYVSDYNNNRVQKWVPGATEGVTVAGGNGQGSGASQLSLPRGIFVNKNGDLYIADYINDRIQKWVPGATEGITVAGGNGYGSAANQFRSPYDVFVTVNGDIYVSDNQNFRIQKWVTGTAAGTTAAGGHGEGSGSNQFNSPIGLYVDSLKNIYVADGFNHRIQKWAPGIAEGVTVAGGNGSGSDNNQFSGSGYVFIDSQNNLYVSDAGNNRVQKFLPDSSVNGIDTTFIPTLGGVYMVTALFKNNCIDTSEAVTVKALPHIYRMNGQKRSLCSGGDFTYSIRGFDDTSTTYNWSVPEGTTLLSGQGTPSIELRIPSTGFSSGALSITTQNSCGSGPIFTDTLSTKPVRPEPITGPAFVNFRDTVVYSTNSDVKDVTYQWVVPEDVDIISGQGTKTLTLQWNRRLHGTIKVFTSVCTNEASMQYIKVAIGNPEFAKQASIIIEKTNRFNKSTPVLYPNPTNKLITVVIEAELQSKFFIELADLTGKMLFKKEDVLIEGQNSVQIDLTNYAKGMYLLSVKDNKKKIQVFKIAKQ